MRAPLSSYQPDDLVRAVERARDRVAGELPEIDQNDLVLILQSLLRPREAGRRLFMRELRPGVYVP